MVSVFFSGGNGNYRLDLTPVVSGLSVRAIVQVWQLGGSGFYTLSNLPTSLWIGSSGWNSTWRYDYQTGPDYVTVFDNTVANAGAGVVNISATVQMDFGPNYGGKETRTVSTSVTTATTPGTPDSGTPTPLSPVSIKFPWSAPGDGGSPITTYQVRRATDAAMTANVVTTDVEGSVREITATSLAPSTTYFFDVQAINSLGGGGRSAVRSAQTLPNVAPGLTVYPSALGTDATAVLTPPGGSTGVQSYNVEVTVGGVTTTHTTTSNSVLVAGLAPGSTNSWRARANFTTYTSPWSTPQAVTQVALGPSTLGFFDGSSEPRGVLSFAWMGSPDASWSVAQESVPLGWEIVVPNPGVAKIHRVGGGHTTRYAARALVTTSLTAAGLYLGVRDGEAYRASVYGEVTYYGTVYVRPSRSQRLTVVIEWLNALGQSLGFSETEGTTVAADVWTRLITTATSPADAVAAVVGVRDIEGTGWSPWLAGQYFDADDAMLSLQLAPYFDGATPNDTEYDYTWEGGADESSSLRTARLQSAFVVRDPDCPPPPSPPRPPSIPNDCIDETGQWRRYWVQVPRTEVAEWLDMVPTIFVTTGSREARQVRIRIYRNSEDLPVSGLINSLQWESEQILSYVPPETTVRLDGITRKTTMTIPGRGQVPANHLLYGTAGGPATWPVLSCGDGYLISIDAPLDAPAGNVTVGLELTQRM